VVYHPVDPRSNQRVEGLSNNEEALARSILTIEKSFVLNHAEPRSATPAIRGPIGGSKGLF